MNNKERWSFGDVLGCADESLLERKLRIQAAETRVIPALSVIRFRSGDSALRILGLDKRKPDLEN